MLKSNKWLNMFRMISGLFLLLLFFELYPRYSELVSDTWKLFIWQQANKEDEQIRLNIQNINLQNTKLKADISSIISDYNEQRSISSIIGYIDSIATNNKLKLTSIKPEVITEERNLLRLPLLVVMEGVYDNLYKFTHEIENSPQVIIIKEMDVKSVYPSRQKVVMELNIEVYLNL